MKAGHNKKSVRVEFVMSEQEAELVKGRMAELGITNLSAYLRKMAADNPNQPGRRHRQTVGADQERNHQPGKPRPEPGCKEQRQRRQKYDP